MLTTAWLTASEVADFLRIHPKTVKRIPADLLPYYRVTAGQRADRRYRIEDVMAWVESRKVGAA